jgi:hypothetical protein
MSGGLEVGAENEESKEPKETEANREAVLTAFIVMYMFLKPSKLSSLNMHILLCITMYLNKEVKNLKLI